MALELLYPLSKWFPESLGVLNVINYITFRAAMAAVTAMIIGVLLGPYFIAWLRRMKIGQTIRGEGIKPLYDRHKDKSGTPTMGGTLILASITISILLWGNLANELVLTCLIVTLALGALGFLDDYTKIKEKQYHGVRAKQKLIVQFSIGLALGFTLYMFHPLISPPLVRISDFKDISAFTVTLHKAATPLSRFLRENMSKETRLMLNDDESAIPPSPALQRSLVEDMNRLIQWNSLYSEERLQGIRLSEETMALVQSKPQEYGLLRLNRMILEEAFPQLITQRRDRPYDLPFPFFKNVFLTLGILYIPFVALVITSASNAVNLTDGLDGLASGCIIIATLAFAALTYIVGRTDWSSYLGIIYVPRSGELCVFAMAVVGATMAFLWYNAHPAQVFMGDTGSLALGGALSTMAVLIKQELLLFIIGGVFVMEACSVILQVVSFRWRKGKRIFLMAPLHHHFEMKGWSETTIVVRFWILAAIFAFIGLATLKVR
ncbi:MAG: phospho-N-acetylmuramoyl-pentapeptide-transferase [Candidatus Omnitrophota bacterium]|jgi:UDP-N-acetylmuramyl pentapeptide phosphotransferase/UDP-N-acetylglucosamine-1-phosphate transferase|nr:MAG: phospho-N-acetylmuramoyl-pentapeptide-transferase [Candidatus Omnitrophota bacterium]